MANLNDIKAIRIAQYANTLDSHGICYRFTDSGTLNIGEEIEVEDTFIDGDNVFHNTWIPCPDTKEKLAHWLGY